MFPGPWPEPRAETRRDKLTPKLRAGCLVAYRNADGTLGVREFGRASAIRDPKPEVPLTHGNQNPTSADETPHTGPDGGVRQPDFGSFTPAEADTASDGPRGERDDRGSLEEYRAGSSGGDAQCEPKPDGTIAGEPEAVLEALEVQLEQRQWSGPSTAPGHALSI